MSKEAIKLRAAAEKVVELYSERPLSLGKWFIDMSEACESLREALAEQPAQRTWVGLTEDEISLIVAECSLVSPSDHYFARAIEAKLKEKNT